MGTDTAVRNANLAERMQECDAASFVGRGTVLRALERSLLADSGARLTFIHGAAGAT